MKKQLLGIVIILLVLAIVPLLAFAEEGDGPTVSFTEVSAYHGDTVEITVDLSNCPPVSFLAMYPIYDESRMQFIKAEWLKTGATLSDWGDGAANSDGIRDETGVILFSSPTDLNGAIAKYTFKLLDVKFWTDIEFSSDVRVRDIDGLIDVSVNPTSIKIICTHEWENKVQNPTCIEKGYNYNECKKCKKQNIISYIDYAEHTPGEWFVNVSPTCTENGFKHKTCIVCNLEMETQPISKIGHTLSDWVTYKEATCLEVGIEQRVCTHCQTVLETKNISILNHTLGEFVVVKEATYLEEGEKTQSCTVCNTVLNSEKIPVLAQSATNPSENGPVQEPGSTQEPDNNSSNKILLIIAIVGLSIESAAAIGVAVFFVVKKIKKVGIKTDVKKMKKPKIKKEKKSEIAKKNLEIKEEKAVDNQEKN